MSEELIKEINNLMYDLNKTDARDSFAELLDDLNITDEEYQEIKAELSGLK